MYYIGYDTSIMLPSLLIPSWDKAETQLDNFHSDTLLDADQGLCRTVANVRLFLSNEYSNRESIGNQYTSPPIPLKAIGHI